MYGDTITITINAVAKPLSKINQDSYGAEYFLKESLGEFRLRISHSKDRVSAGAKQRDRHSVVLTETIYATVSAAEIKRTSKVEMTGNYDDSAAGQAYNQVGLQTWASQANLVKLVGWES